MEGDRRQKRIYLRRPCESWRVRSHIVVFRPQTDLLLLSLKTFHELKCRLISDCGNSITEASLILEKTKPYVDAIEAMDGMSLALCFLAIWPSYSAICLEYAGVY